MFDSSVGVLTHFLGGFDAILKKAEAHAQARRIDPEALLNARLYPDMFPFTRQVQIATDHAKGAGARLAGIPVPGFPDEEKSFADLHARIAKTLDFLRSLKKEQFTDAAGRNVTLKIGDREMSFTGADYLNRMALPNFFFHLTTAYALLRHNGVEIGKRDFMARP